MPYLSGKGYLADVTRRRKNSLQGILEKIIFEAFRQMKEEGVVWGNMGLSPLYNVADEVKSIKVQEITVQTLLLAGEYDFIKEAHLREIEDIIPNAELVIIKGSGHLLPTEKSEEINQLILGFINKTLS